MKFKKNIQLGKPTKIGHNKRQIHGKRKKKINVCKQIDKFKYRLSDGKAGRQKPRQPNKIATKRTYLLRLHNIKQRQ